VTRDRADARLDLVWARDAASVPRSRLEQAYGSAVTFPATRPYVLANFVQTIDGVVAFGTRGGDNAATVSMGSAIDRHVMALLRAQADAIVIGAGTFRIARNHQWSPGGLVPDETEAFDDLRASLHGAGAKRAPLYVVTASGAVDPAQVAFTAPETRVAVVTTQAGAARLAGRLPAHVDLLASGEGREIDPLVLREVVAARSGGLILCEGGPHLLGALARAGLVDELFLTIAPQIAGRDGEHRRLGLVEGFAATPDEAPRLRMHSLRRAEDHLFARYDRGPAGV
jgi:riboflavin biosynthesis pyrimidine reductase